MIFVRLISGLGNQLFQYTIGRQLSITKNVPLKLDLSFFGTQALRSFKLNHYNIQAEIASEREVERVTRMYKSTRLHARIYRKVERSLPKYRRHYFKEAGLWIYEPELMKVRPKVYLDGYWQHYKYFENIDQRVMTELTLKEPYKQPLLDMVSAIQEDRNSVSLHVRRGDYLTDPDAYNLFGVLPEQYYYRAIELMNEKLKTPSFYIFSDDLNWVKDNLKINAPVTLVDIEGGKKDYIELDLMSKCAHHIIANSSFSWWGAFLNRNLNKTVIAPANWVLPTDINSKIELQFPSWIKI